MTEAIVVAGASGAGKTTVARKLAGELGLRYVDADDLHSEHNIAKMQAGSPLTDEDRYPWLDHVAGVLAQGSVVIACSALRRRYRDRLREGAPDTFVVLLRPPADVLAQRLADRRGHFMPPSLLASQLAALEPLEIDERGVEAMHDVPSLEIVRKVALMIRARPDFAWPPRADASAPPA